MIGFNIPNTNFYWDPEHDATNIGIRYTDETGTYIKVLIKILSASDTFISNLPIWEKVEDAIA